MTEPAPLTDEELAEIEARAEAATPGPWYRRADRYVEAECRLTAGDIVSATRSMIAQTRWTERDNLDNEAAHTALFIAHAREDVPRLIAEVERLRSEARRLDPYKMEA